MLGRMSYYFMPLHPCTPFTEGNVPLPSIRLPKQAQIMALQRDFFCQSLKESFQDTEQILLFDNSIIASHSLQWDDDLDEGHTKCQAAGGSLFLL